MRKLYHYTIIGFFLILAHVFVPLAHAHPLGNFTINHYTGLHVNPQEFVVDYILDMAEIPAFQEIAAMDANNNGQADPEETTRYHFKQCKKIQPDLELRANRQLLPLRLIAVAIEFPPGQGGLLTLRLTCTFKAVMPEIKANEMQVEFENHSFASRMGWREIVVTADGVTLHGDFATTSISDRLTSYPQDLLSNPLDQRRVSLVFAPVGVSGTQPSPRTEYVAQGLPVDRNDAFTRLITLEEFNLSTLVVALLISIIWGAMHALTPGHGKTIVGAYLVGSRGTARHAFYLGLMTTITHTAGVFALGLVTLFAARFILPEKLFPWLSFLSGLLVISIGVNLFLSRLRSIGLVPWLREIRLGYARLIPPQPVTRVALEHSHAALHVHEHSHSHPHPHNHDHSLVHNHEHPTGDEHVHDHDHDHNRGHAHLPPGADGSPVTWRNLLALGISGGLLPCPSALVVLLSAIALNRTGFGLLLVLAFSLGLAGVLTGIGLVFVYARRLFERVPLQGRIFRFLPAVSALFIALVGFGITVRALVEIGVIKL